METTLNDDLFKGASTPHKRGHPLLLDDYILRLQALREEVGGQVPVQKWTPATGRIHAPMPEVAYKKQLIVKIGLSQRTVTLPQFWQANYDEVLLRGDVVVRV